MCKGLSSLPSTCLEKAKGMRVKLSHLAETHQKHKLHDAKTLQDLETVLNNKNFVPLKLFCSQCPVMFRVYNDKLSSGSKGGLHAFRVFLCSEFSEENLEFWLACEDYRVSSSNLQRTKASSICSRFIKPDAPQEVNLDAETREALLSVMDSPCADTFNKAQQKIFSLMAKDSFPRFLRSHHGMETIRAF